MLIYILISFQIFGVLVILKVSSALFVPEAKNWNQTEIIKIRNFYFNSIGVTTDLITI